MAEFKLPDVGEGLTEAEIVTWKVKEGDTIEINDIVVEIETAKSLVELPSPFAGVVQSAAGARGRDRRRSARRSSRIGDALDAPLPSRRSAAPAEQTESDPYLGMAERPAPSDAQCRRDRPLQPGGQRRRRGRDAGRPQQGRPRRRRRRRARAAARPRRAVPPPSCSSRAPSGPAAPSTRVVEDEPTSRPSRRPRRAPGAGGDVRALAKPPVRKLAKDLGVDLTALTGTGPNGAVTRDDVQSAQGGAARVLRRGCRSDRCVMRPGRRAGDARADQGRPQDDGPGDGRLGVLAPRTSPSG